MGDNFYLHRFADNQPNHRSVAHRSPPTPAPEPPELANGDEEDYTIRCICDFNDDDGNTVLCEPCNTWQHIVCYYYPRESLDDDFHHTCVICNPRHVDAQLANQMQHKRRDPVAADEKKARRSTAKSHKKSKTHINGDISRVDGRDGSPRDGAPPAKRPKTTHRHSGSVVSVSGGQRGRAMSTVKRMPSLAELPPDYFSPEFLEANRGHSNFVPAAANLHLNIGITNMLSSWLDDEESFTRDTNGKTHQDVFMHLPQPMEELEVPVEKHTETRTDVAFHGQHPLWHKLKATRDLSAGDFVGELCGDIGHQADFKADPANKWDKLKHPDQFVFFHPVLPIFIDCRSEGSLLRYVRRSCHPNLRISTLITGEREYRFCFTATCEIPQGAELTVKWDFEPDLSVSFNSRQPMGDDVRDRLSSRAEILLSHFGGCACDAPHCLMVHFDRRIREQPEPLEENAKPIKNGKKRKASKKSPTDGHPPGVSRASSEAVTHGDGDEDMEDTRSTSQSTKVSRDNTPSGGLNGAAKGLESSERERRKLAQQERLFEQMDAPKRRKRNSASTAHATPDAMSVRNSSKRPSHPNTPMPSSKPRGPYNGHAYPSAIGRPSPDNRSPVSAMGQPRSAPISPQTPAPKPVYCDASTQTLPEEDLAATPTPTRRRAFLPLSRRLIRRSIKSMPQSRSPSRESPSGAYYSAPPMSSTSIKEQPQPLNPPPPADAEMKDAPPQKDKAKQDVEMTGVGGDADDGKQQPRDSTPATNHAKSSAADEGKDAPNVNGESESKLHVNLPSLPTFGQAPTAGTIATGTQSPSADGPSPTGSARSSLTSPFLEVPPVAGTPAMARPSPVKKMTLSDYLSKRKAETPALEKPPSQIADAAEKESVKQEQSS